MSITCRDYSIRFRVKDLGFRGFSRGLGFRV
jgi:hypothetical protein